MEHVPGYPQTKHWPSSMSVHRDDSYHLDPEFFVQKPVIITEKLDGGNTLLARGEVYARSTFLPSHDGWFAEVRKRHGYKTANLSPNLFIYGEDLYGIHSVEYDPLRDTYYVFNIRNLDYWYSWEEIEEESASLGLSIVPVWWDSRRDGMFNSVEEITRFFMDNLSSPSRLGPTKEGFVMRTLEGFDNKDFTMSMVKFVRPKHVQTDDKHWKKNWQPARLVRE